VTVRMMKSRHEIPPGRMCRRIGVRGVSSSPEDMEEEIIEHHHGPFQVGIGIPVLKIERHTTESAMRCRIPLFILASLCKG